MRAYHLAYILGASVLFISGCSGDEQEEPTKQESKTEVKAVATPKPTPVQPVDLGDGLTYMVLTGGTGEQAIESGDDCQFDVVLSTSEGEEIWTGEFEFTIGSGQAIEGFDRGCRGMKPGEKREIKVPWALGYGTKGLDGDPPINPKQDLVFEISFIEFTTKEESN